MEGSELRAVLGRIENANSSEEVGLAVLQGACAVLQSPVAIWWIRSEEGSQIVMYDGQFREVPYNVASGLEFLEPRRNLPVAHNDAAIQLGSADIFKIAIAPYMKNSTKSWIAVANRGTDYSGSDLTELGALAAIASMSIDVYMGHKRMAYARLWEHYLRTPLWTLAMTLEDIKRDSPESVALVKAFGASAVLSSQMGTFLCDLNLEDQRLETLMSLKEGMRTLRRLGEAWTILENRGFDLFDEDITDEYRVKQGALQLLLTVVNSCFVDRQAGGVCIAMEYRGDDLYVVVEANDFIVPERGRLHRIMMNIARRYAVSLKCSDTIRGEAIEIVIPLQLGQPPVAVRKEDGKIPVVMVVDDSSVNRDYLAGMLAAMGIPVTTAHDGADAVARVDIQNPPDLVFMDLLMPVMTGQEATVELRSRGLRCPILAFTAGGVSDLASAIEAGMDDTLFKPMSRKLLESVLYQWTGYVADEMDRSFETEALQIAREAFMKELPDMCAQLVHAIERSDYEAVISLSHRMKGDSAQGGFAEFSSFIDQLGLTAKSSGDMCAFRSRLMSHDPLSLA